jgi:hypothetical protein
LCGPDRHIRKSNCSLFVTGPYFVEAARRALILALLIHAAPAAVGEFQITSPENIAPMTMPCWSKRQLAAAMTKGKFEPVVCGTKWEVI